MTSEQYEMQRGRSIRSNAKDLCQCAFAICMIALLWGGRAMAEPIKAESYYRLTVSLRHDDEPITLDVVFTCGLQARTILGEPPGAVSVRVPFMYGIKTHDGHAVLVRTPDVCGRAISRDGPPPSDLFPLVFWADRADDLEFTVAYLTPEAYRQPASKLTWINSELKAASAEDYKAWKSSAAPNIIPMPRPDSLARMWTAAQGFLLGIYPPDDPRNYIDVTCHSMVFLPLPEADARKLEETRPGTHPDYWFVPSEVFTVFLNRAAKLFDRMIASVLPSGKPLTAAVERSVNLRQHDDVMDNSSDGFEGVSAGQAPFFISTGVPWSGGDPTRRGTVSFHVETKGGLDHGFAYCYKDRIFDSQILGDFTRPSGPFNAEFTIDDQPVGTIQDYKYSLYFFPMAKGGRFIAVRTTFYLSDEFSRVQ